MILKACSLSAGVCAACGCPPLRCLPSNRLMAALPACHIRRERLTSPARGTRRGRSDEESARSERSGAWHALMQKPSVLRHADACSRGDLRHEGAEFRHPTRLASLLVFSVRRLDPLRHCDHAVLLYRAKRRGQREVLVLSSLTLHWRASKSRSHSLATEIAANQRPPQRCHRSVSSGKEPCISIGVPVGLERICAAAHICSYAECRNMWSL